MKQLRYIIIVLAFVLTSCNKFLDITPDGQVKRDEMLQTTEGIEDALYGVYAQLRTPSLYGENLSIYVSEVMAGYLESYGNETVEALAKYDYTNTRVKSVFESVWTKMYNNISNVNSVLGADLVKNATEYPFIIYKGEALALRAFMHFDLLRLYAEQITQNPKATGIPYATEFSLKTPDFVHADTVYQHILADLAEAETLLKDEAKYRNTTAFMNDRQTHLNLYAVKALLARVYLTMGNKEKALAYAEEVIENSGRTLCEKTELNGDLAGIFSTKETIFGIYHSDFYKSVSPLLQQSISFYSLSPRKDINNFYEADIVGLDYRFAAWFTARSSEMGGYTLSKLTDIYELQNISSQRPKDKILGINIIRLPEMYYIVAECLLDTDYDEAVSVFNEMITHRGLEPLDRWPAEKSILTIDAINAERFREFIGEGVTFFNLKRQHLPISAADGTTIAPSKNIFTVPIPDIEYDYRN